MQVKKEKLRWKTNKQGTSKTFNKFKNLKEGLMNMLQQIGHLTKILANVTINCSPNETFGDYKWRNELIKKIRALMKLLMTLKSLKVECDITKDVDENSSLNETFNMCYNKLFSQWSFWWNAIEGMNITKKLEHRHSFWWTWKAWRLSVT
jgi:hypothetical protein